MRKLYEIAQFSIKGGKKGAHEKTGDCCVFIDSGDCVFMALSDGVGTCADDARASRTVCDMLAEFCGKAIQAKQQLTESSLAQFCTEIDTALWKAGDKACLSAIVWYPDQNELRFINVGDTRIYKWNVKEGLTQMTEDDHGKAVVVKINGKIHTVNGTAVMSFPIDRAIGDRKNKYHCGRLCLEEGECLILSSDGMYNSDTFKWQVQELAKSISMSEVAQNLTTTDDDDASLLILRRNIKLESSFSISKIMEDYDQGERALPDNAVIDGIVMALTNMVETGENATASKTIVEFAHRQQLYPQKEIVIDLLETVAKRHDQLEDSEKKKDYYVLYSALYDLLSLVAAKV